MNFAKIIILGISVLFTNTLFAATIAKKEPVKHYERCDTKLFYAKTVDNRKEVKICLYDQTITYSYGDIYNPVREKFFSLRIDDVSINPSPDIDNFAIYKNNFVYEILYYHNNKNVTSGYLTIANYDSPHRKLLKTIKLNPSTVESNITMLNQL